MKKTENGYVFESSGRAIDASEVERGLSLCIRKEENIIQYGYDGRVFFRDEKTGEYDTELTPKEKKELAMFMVEQWADFGCIPLIDAVKPTPLEVEFNINSFVQVKLTEAGFNHWMEEFNSPLPLDMEQPLSFFKSRADKNGYVVFQLWRFMKHFGRSISCDHSDKQLFDANLKFSYKDFK